MIKQDLFEKALIAAESENQELALSLFLQLVEENPYHEEAWIWLCDLVDNPEDRIIALENVLTINPQNEDARILLDTLKRANAQNTSPSTPVFRAVPTEPLGSKKSEMEGVRSILSETTSPTQPLQDRRVREARSKSQFMAVERALDADDLNAVLTLLVQMVEEDENNEQAWYLLGILAPVEEDQRVALENVLVLNPHNEDAKKQLKKLDLDIKVRVKQEALGEDKREAYRVITEYLNAKNGNIENIRKTVKNDTPIANDKKISLSGPSKSLLQKALKVTAIFALILLASIFFISMKFTPWMIVGTVCVFVGSISANIASMNPRHPIWIDYFGPKDKSMDRTASLAFGSLGWILLIGAFLLLTIDIIQSIIILI